MKTQAMFCPACGRSVDVVLPDSPLHGSSQATLPDPEAVCVESRRCPDGDCAVTGRSAVVMRLRLAHANAEGWIAPVCRAEHADFLDAESADIDAAIDADA